MVLKNDCIVVDSMARSELGVCAVGGYYNHRLIEEGAMRSGVMGAFI